MLEINVKECKNCGIQELLDGIDDKLYKLGRDQFHNAIYLSNPPSNSFQIKRLIRYKNILENIRWNSSYYSFPYEQIISKIKTLI